MARKMRLLLVVVATTCGCRAAQLAKDHEAFRRQLGQMYTDQVMGNLVRCEQGLPFVQLDYSKITGTITQDSSASFEDSQAVTNARAFSALGIFTGLTRTIATTYKGTLSFKQTNQLTFTADPVVNQPSVYYAYLQFLNKPGALVCSPEPPPPCAAIVVKQCGDCYYWVPSEFRADFRELCLRTVSMRGEPIEMPTYFETKVLGLVDLEPVGLPAPEGSQAPQQWEATLAISPSLPVDSGTFDAFLKGRLYHFNFEAPLDVSEVGTGGEKPKMDRIVLQYVQDPRPADQIPEEDIAKNHVPLSPPQLAEELAKQTLKVKLNINRPPVPSTSDLLRSIDNELGLIRLDQLRSP